MIQNTDDSKDKKKDMQWKFFLLLCSPAVHFVFWKHHNYYIIVYPFSDILYVCLQESVCVCVSFLT